MSATVESILATVRKPAEMAAAELSISSIYHEQEGLREELRNLESESTGLLTRQRVDQIRQRRAEIDTHNATLRKALKPHRQTVARLRSAHAVAVQSALLDFRHRAAERALAAIDDLIAAARDLHSSRAAIVAAGSSVVAFPEPPLLEHIASIARSIMAERE